jgi:hypothetical protein
MLGSVAKNSTGSGVADTLTPSSAANAAVATIDANLLCG